MTSTTRSSFVLAAAGLLVTSGVWFSGCVEANAPDSPPPVSVHSTGPDGATFAEFIAALELVLYDIQKNPEYLTPVSATISASKGGTITAGQFKLFIPAKALQQDTKITVYPFSLIQQSVAVEPTGLQFRPGYSATLTFDYKGTNAKNAPASSLVASWFNPSTGAWEAMPSGQNDSRKYQYVTTLEHFSYYALSKRK